MPVDSCIPVIPSANLDKSLRLWVDVLGFERDTEIREDGRLIFCMLHKGNLHFMLNRRAGTSVKPDDYNGIRLYWHPLNINEMRQRLIQFGYEASEICDRDYGQTEFFLTDDDGFSHCFGVSTSKRGAQQRLKIEDGGIG
jgi:hypothetical protein